MEKSNLRTEHERIIEELTEKTKLAHYAEMGIGSLFRIELKPDNLDKIPKDKKIIFAVTHMSDFDIPIAIAALANKFPRLKVAGASTHERFAVRPVSNLVRRITGDENHFSIDYPEGTERKLKGKSAQHFNPDNFGPMKEALEAGNQMVVAAYFDTAYQGGKWKLPSKGGMAAAYLAQVTPDSVVVPVAVDIRTQKHFGMGNLDIEYILNKRPEVDVKLGLPLEPERISPEKLEVFTSVLRKIRDGQMRTTEEKKQMLEMLRITDRTTRRIMSELSEILPVEKRSDSL